MSESVSRVISPQTLSPCPLEQRMKALGVLHESARQVTRIIVTSPLNQVPPGVDLNNMRVDPETPELPFWIIKRYGEAPTPESVLDREKDKNPTEGWSVVQLLPIPS